MHEMQQTAQQWEVLQQLAESLHGQAQELNKQGRCAEAATAYARMHAALDEAVSAVDVRKIADIITSRVAVQSEVHLLPVFFVVFMCTYTDWVCLLCSGRSCQLHAM
jgi:hypothetical protein